VTADYLVIGAGLYGAVTARRLADAGHTVRVIERHPGIGGLCRTSVHHLTGERYNPHGTHVLTTSDAGVMRFLTRFAQFDSHRYTVQAVAGDRQVPMPIGLAAVRACYGDDVTTEQAQRILDQATAAYRDKPAATVQDAALGIFGPRLYETFVRGYVEKQWGSDPAELSAEVITSRFRLDLSDRGFFPDCLWQAVPRLGYTALLERMFSHPQITVTTDFRSDPDNLPAFRTGCVHTEPIDEFFGCRLGVLTRRYAHIVWTSAPGIADQGTVVTTHPGRDVPYYRVHQPRHLPWNRCMTGSGPRLTGYEFGGLPEPGTDAPTVTFVQRTFINEALAARYRQLATHLPGHVFAGRGTTFYDDMAATVNAATAFTADLLAGDEGRRAAVP